MLRVQSILFFALALSGAAAPEARAEELIREEFAEVDRWTPLTFPKISRHSSYTPVVLEDGRSALRTETRGSASGLIHQTEFNPRTFPIVRWRWRVDAVYEGLDPHAKSGDDYPLRVFILFPYDAERAGVFERMQYGSIRALYGEYPPAATLNYVWASEEIDTVPLSSPYTDRAKIIPLRTGTAELGRWLDETVDIAKDYRRAFGGELPSRARLAVMSDSDNSGRSAVAYFDLITVSGAAEESK